MTALDVSREPGIIQRFIWLVGVATLACLLMSGAWQVLYADRVLGLIALALGSMLLFGVLKRKVYAYQSLSIGYLLSAIGLMAFHWHPPPEGEGQWLSSAEFAITLVALAALFVGNAWLASNFHARNRANRRAIKGGVSDHGH